MREIKETLKVFLDKDRKIYTRYILEGGTVIWYDNNIEVKNSNYLNEAYQEKISRENEIYFNR